MRTEADASAARIKKKKRSSERSKRHDRPAEEEAGGGGEWKQFTSPDGHPYYYNAVTKESRWELPTEEQPPARSKHRRPKGSSKQIILEQETPQTEAPADNKPKKEKKKRPESRRSATDEAPSVRKSKNAMFQKLQASLEGRLNGPMMGRPPPMLSIRQEGEVGYAGGATEENKTPSLEEQYEAETAGMSAAERLRFLRKKRQENMMAKRESIAGDDFMAEVANNMKKKGATLKSKEKVKDSGDKVMSWKEQELAEEERKRQQMQAEMEAKEQEAARKEREEQAAKERELRREQERAEQAALEERREQERRQRQEDDDRRRLEKEEKKKKKKEEKKKKKDLDEMDERSSEHDTVAASEKVATQQDTVATTGKGSTGAQDEEVSEASSPERVRHRRRSRSRGSKHGSSIRSLQYEHAETAESTNDDHSPVEDENSARSGKVASDPLQDEKQRAREERRTRKQREKELEASKRTEPATSESQRRKSVSSAGDLTEDSSIRTSSSAEAEEEARQIQKQLRRERRRVAKLEAALAAQSMGGDQHERSQDGHTEQHAANSNGSTPGSAHAGAYPQSPPPSGGMYPPYPYMMMPPPPPPPSTPYGYYYPYMQPPPMMPPPMYPPSVVSVPPGYQLVPQTPPPSSDGMAMPSAMVPYSAESTMEGAYGMPFRPMYGQQPAPELSKCDCCQGIGVGLVEKNGVCAHCNRLRLAFIVDSAQMRQRCFVCGGWGFQLLQANGMCEHCTRQTAQKSTKKLIARRRSSAAVPRAPVPVPVSQNSTGNHNALLDDVDWDKSSSDDSDWDD